MQAHYSHPIRRTGIDPTKRAVQKAFTRLLVQNRKVDDISGAHPVDFHNLTHLQLVRYLGVHPENNAAWLEFQTRFHKRIYFRILETCERLGHRKGLRDPEDLAQDVYLKLLRENAKALRTFQGLWENSVYCFLDVISERTAILNWEYDRMQKRIPQSKCCSLDKPIQSVSHNDTIRLLDTIRSDSAVESQRYSDTKNALLVCINEILRNKLHGERDRQIFELYFLEGYSPQEISELFSVGVSPKRISNRITEIKGQISSKWRKYVN